jgi:hypothetical protein
MTRHGAALGLVYASCTAHAFRRWSRAGVCTLCPSGGAHHSTTNGGERPTGLKLQVVACMSCCVSCGVSGGRGGAM